MLRGGWSRKKTFELGRRSSQNLGRYLFTLHALYKMNEYHLSRQRVTRVIRSPRRTEEGIVPDTVAVMQPSSTKRVNGKETWTQEIWVMYKVNSKKNPPAGGKSSKLENQKIKFESMLTQPQLKIISTWRYPGVSPERDPIPVEILREIEGWNSMEEEA